MNFAEFCSDANLLNLPVSPAWACAFKVLDGEPLADAERALLGQMGVGEPTAEVIRELWAIKGRRAQGTAAACQYLIFKLATCGSEFRRYATPRERLHVPIIAQTRDVAREIKTRLDHFYQDSPVLSAEIEELTKTQILLKSGFVLSVWTCSYRAPRGIAAPLALLDEVGIWRTEGADVDREVVRSLLPAMTQFPNRKLVALGTPWTKAGVLYEAWQRRAERPDRLVVHVPTPLANSLIAAEELERERQADPENYRREFLAEWSDAVDSFIPGGDVDAAVMAGRRELPPAEGIDYVGAIDAAGGGADWFTLCIAHRQGDALVFDCLRGWQRQPLDTVLFEIRKIREAYRLRNLVGDQYAHQALAQLFRDHGVCELKKFEITSDSKREVYADFKLKLAQGRVELLDHPESLRQLRALEAKRTSGGGVKIGAPPGLHDDFPAAMVLVAHDGHRGGVWVEATFAGEEKRGWHRIS